MNDQLFIDGNGVPWVVQGVKYHYSDMTVDLTFFDGSHLRMCVFDVVGEGVGLFQSSLTPIQILQIEQFCESYWTTIRGSTP